MVIADPFNIGNYPVDLDKNNLYKYSTKSRLIFTEKHQFDEKNINYCWKYSISKSTG
jgi:hypothetical protein